MTIKLYNSLTNQIEEFQPLQTGLVRMYSCGPTVYNYAHIGNMRAFLFADLLQRTLQVVGKYKVLWVMNITNIDDKTIKSSQIGSPDWLPEMGEQTADPMENLLKFTTYYEKAFLEDISTLGIDLKHIYAMPRATEYIKPMQELILKIIENGFAYPSGGSIYFDLSAYRKKETYGKLFKIDFEHFQTGKRIDADQYEREEVSDFVLWKARKENEPYWDFYINGENYPGRPGWHIECSAMEAKLLGLPFDIHTGGVDLKFPHHEDEIAQSKAGYQIEPTAFWCHNEFLEVEGKKMSKSLGNFFTTKDLLAQNYNPKDIRFSIFSAHYRSIYNFSKSGTLSAQKGREKIQDFIYALFEETQGNKEIDVNEVRNSVFQELANDLHTPKALANLFTFINQIEPNELTTKSKRELIEFFKELNNIFNVWEINKKVVEIPPEIIELAEQRLEAKKSKNWAEADRIRNIITEKGYIIKDTKDSYIIEKA